MTTPHETLFFLTGGTGPHPTHAAFVAAAAQRTAKTKEGRRTCEVKKGEMRVKQVQREQALKEVGGFGSGMMRLFGLRVEGKKGNRKDRGITGGQVDKGAKASGGGGEAEKDVGGTSKEESAKDAGGSKEAEKGASENNIVQSASYDAGVFSHGGTRRGAHHGTPLVNGDNAGDDGHISIGENPFIQDGEAETLLDADEVITSTPGLLDGDKLDSKKDATVGDRESVASNKTHKSLSLNVQPIPENVHSHIPDAPPVLSGTTGSKVDSGTNPNNTRPSILTPNTDDNSDPVCQNNTPQRLESGMALDTVQPTILVTAPDPDDSAEGISIKDTAPGLQSDINPHDIQPPIIAPVPDPDDNSNDPQDRPPELSQSIPASLGPQDAEPEVQFRHDEGDPFSPTPHLPPPWEPANIPHPHEGKAPE